MTDEERIAVKDYIDARITPIERDVRDIKRTVDKLFTSLEGVQATDQREAGADDIKRMFFRYTIAIVSASAAVGGVVVAALS